MNLNATLLGEMIMFFLFVWFTMAKVWPPIVAILQERQKRIADGLAAGEQGRLALENAQAQSKVVLQEAKVQATNVIEQANLRAQQIMEQAKTDALKESQRIKALAASELAQEVESARTELQQHIGRFATMGAERIIRQSIDANLHRELINDLVNEL